MEDERIDRDDGHAAVQVGVYANPDEIVNSAPIWAFELYDRQTHRLQDARLVAVRYYRELSADGKREAEP